MKKTKTNYIIYYLVDNDGVPFYVGLTKNLRKRINSHRHNAHKGCHYPVYNKIRKLWRNNLDFEAERIEEIISIDEANKLERLHISSLKLKGIKLFNTQPGGNSHDNYKNQKMRGKDNAKFLTSRKSSRKHSEETKKRISKARLGMKFSEEHKNNLSIARRNRVTTDETRRKTSETSTGKINIKVVKLISPDGEIFETERGITQFCKDHGLTQANISKVALGLVDHYKGWRKA